MKNVFKLTIGIVLLTLVFSRVGWSQSVHSVADIVLIIDSSGSMMENDPRELRKKAANQFIDLAESDVQIGVVDFDERAKTLAELTFAINTTDLNTTDLKDGKNKLKDAVERIDAYEGTNIAAGLQQGFEVLSNSTTFTARKAAVLLTDGEDNEQKTLDTYVGNYVANGWSVYTIGLDDGVSVDRELLEDIAAETLEGEYYSVTQDNIQLVYNTILAKITLKSVVLASPSGFINQGQTLEKPVSVDEWVTKADFTLSWRGSTIEMVLVDPGGAVITPDIAATLGINYQVAPTYAIYTVDNPMQGEWKMRITGTDIPPEGEPYSIVVTGASDFVTNFLAFEPNYAIGDTVRIGIRISEKTGDTAQPIIGATTSATVVRPDGRIETLNLFDDGTHNDNAAGDGIYATDYTNVDILGTYLIRVSVQNGFSREIRQQIIVGAIDNVFVDGATLIPAAGATLKKSPNLISAVISGPAGKIDSESIVLKIDGKIVAHTYDAVNQLVSFEPAKLSRDTHTASLEVNNTIETNWSFTIESAGISRFNILMVLLDNELNLLAAPSLSTQTDARIFVVSCNLRGINTDARYTLTAKNMRTGAEAISGDAKTPKAVGADLNRNSVVQAGDILEMVLRDTHGTIVAGPIFQTVTSTDIHNAYLRVQLTVGDVLPKRTVLAQNYPNPFNPETWIPYQLSEPVEVSIQIYDGSGHLVRTLNVGLKSAGVHTTRSRAAYWDGKNESGERVASGVYFYTLQIPEFSATRRMVILK